MTSTPNKRITRSSSASPPPPSSVKSHRRGHRIKAMKMDKIICSICLEEISKETSAFLDGCVEHLFCYPCIKRWTKTSRSRRSRNGSGESGVRTLSCPTCRKEFTRIRMKETSELKFLRKKSSTREGRQPKETKEAREKRREKERKDGERKDFSDDEEEDLSCTENDDDVDNGNEEEEEYYENDVLDLIASGEACHICREYDVDEDGILLLCDGCERAMHPHCCGFGERTVPDGDFLCPECHRVAMRHANVRVRGNDFQRKYVDFYMNRRTIHANNNNSRNNNRNNNRGNSAARAIDLPSSSEDDEYRIL